VLRASIHFLGLFINCSTYHLLPRENRLTTRLIGEGIKNIPQRAVYKPIIISIKYFNNRPYLLTYHPRLEIIELNDNGQITAVYWADFDEVYEANDLAILDINGEKRLYVAHTHPLHHSIDVFQKKS
jgi:hypothetical protein